MGKIVFIYDQSTMEFNGSYECQESPLEPGVYIVPSASTEIEPPSDEQGKVTIWNGTDWVQINDVRGEWFDASGNIILVNDIRYDVTGLSKVKPVVQTIVTSVTRRQGRRALLQAGLLNQVEAAIDSIQDELTRESMRIDWQDATEFKRGDNTIKTLATALGLSDEQLDQLFIDASKY